MDMYSRLPPEEQKIIQATLLAAAAALWLALAWEEIMVLFALPALAIVATLLIRVARKHQERRDEDILY